jgi:hypothetical protein
MFYPNLLSLEKKYVCMWISFILLTVRLKGRIFFLSVLCQYISHFERIVLKRKIPSVVLNFKFTVMLQAIGHLCPHVAIF